MQFCSIEYIAFFLLVFILHWSLCKSKKWQNLLLLCASYFFYGLFNWKFIPLLFLMSLISFAAGYFLNKWRESDKLKKKAVCTASIILDVVILGYFKYSNFFLQCYNDIFDGSYSILNIIVPVGISFYTFSSISYVVDVYKGRLNPSKDLVTTLLYTSFFPSLLSGPIHKADVQYPQYLKARTFDFDRIATGFESFVWGAFMKLCVADRIGMYVDAVYSNIQLHNGTSLLIAAVFYSFQIYADFAGYSLMAVGSGEMLGIKLQTNFNLPYFSRTITEFWSRWHISLTSWFREYVYIPLGGNRVPKIRWVTNILLVFLISGLWHGAAYTFMIWGLIHGAVQVVEKLIYKDHLKRIGNDSNVKNVFRWFITMSIVTLAWVFFRLPTVSDSVSVIRKIFSDPGTPFIDKHTILFSLAALFLLLLKEGMERFIPSVRCWYKRHSFLRLLSLVSLIVIIILIGKLDSGSFIYFQF